MDRESKRGIIFTGILYIMHIVIIVVALNIGRENFTATLGTVLGFVIFITFVEYISQEINWKKIKKCILVWNLVVKGILICFSISTISLLIVVTLLIYFSNEDTITKGIFNLMITFTFLSTISCYRLYLVINIPERIENIITKYKKGEKTFNAISRNRIYDKEVINKIDFITICATVFLLGNSTFTTLTPGSLTFKKFPYNSIEFNSLLYLIPVYVQSAYYKLFKK